MQDWTHKLNIIINPFIPSQAKGWGIPATWKDLADFVVQYNGTDDRFALCSARCYVSFIYMSMMAPYIQVSTVVMP